MRVRPFHLALLTTILAVGCEKPEPITDAPATTRPAASQPATTMLAPAATLPNIPATTQAFEAPDPLADPVTAIEYMYGQIKIGNLDAVRMMTAEPVPMSEIRKMFAPTVEQLRNGATVTIADKKNFNNVAMIICHFKDRNGQDESFFAMPMMERYDRWRVQLTDVNTRRLTEGEVNNLRVAVDWAKKRVADLRDEAAKARATSAPAKP